MKSRPYLRDFIVYVYTALRFLFLKGHFRLFLQDLSFFPDWRNYRISPKGTLEHRVPWLVFGCISFLEGWLRKGMKVFEYGSGGSTLYLAERVASIVSVEHDSQWYEHAEEQITRSGFTNIQYLLLAPQPAANNASIDCSNPVNYVSCFTEYKGKEFSAYARFIDGYPDESFDLVIVDGRVRHSCIAHAMQKVKKQGILLLDNADRGYYLAPFPELFDSGNWKQLTFTGHFPFGPASVLNTTKLFIRQ